jgi:hypothetical protein
MTPGGSPPDETLPHIRPQEESMQIPKDQILSLIRDQAGDTQAQQATNELPDQVDHEQHADLLRKFNIDPQDLLQRFGGGLGKL